MKKLKKPVWIAILCISVAVILGAAFFLYRYLTQEDISGESLAPTSSPATEAPQKETSVATQAQAPTEKPVVEAWGYHPAEPEDLEVSFEELMEINPDIYAWIYIPNTNVDYPVARSTGDGDDSFYLEHNIYRQYQFSGTIYSEIKNQPDFHDRVTVLYGHNMLNGSMFASLHYFEDEGFFNENNTIFILTKDKVLTYLVYSVYTYDDRHILNSFHMDDDEVFREYIDSTLEPHAVDAIVREGVKPTIENHILTLSTCTSGPANTRFLVQGVLVDESDR
ncbi:MAG: class B sortase [Ruminococcus sp.]|nr:class B sortase [Ruminococcus sp.]